MTHKERNDMERRLRFEKYWNRLDTDGSGDLDYEEFKQFLKDYNKKEMPEKQNEFYFRGSDIDGGGSIDQDELFQLVEALYKNDQLYINKLFFRAVDTDKSGLIDASEFVLMADLNNRKMSEEDAQKQIERLTGGNSEMTFAQMHKALTGEDVPDDLDPYDGRLKEENNYPSDDYFGNAYPPHEESEYTKKGKKEKPTRPGGSSVVGLAKILLIVMIALSGLAFVAWVISGASYLLLYQKMLDLTDKKMSKDEIDIFCETLNPSDDKGKKSCKSEYYVALFTGFSPKDSTTIFVNLKYQSLVTLLLSGLMCLLFAVLELILVIIMGLQVVGTKIPYIIINLAYAPVTRGILGVLFSIPTLGTSNDLGISAGIILIIVSAAIIVVGIIEKILCKSSKVAAA